jgi:hypothetical protein
MDTGKPNWKPLPYAVTRLKKEKRTAADDERARTKIRKLDSYTCRVCGRRTMVVHEHKRRGAGGVVSAENSFCACDVLDGGLCHPLLQARSIHPVCPVDPFNAREALVFEMTRKIADEAFHDRPVTPHVRIVS